MGMGDRPVFAHRQPRATKTTGMSLFSPAPLPHPGTSVLLTNTRDNGKDTWERYGAQNWWCPHDKSRWDPTSPCAVTVPGCQGGPSQDRVGTRSGQPEG